MYESSQPRQGLSVLKVLLIGCAAMAGLILLALAVGVAYLSQGPDTSVYTGNQVPQKFLKIAKELGALEDGERIIYFYSDALVDIKDGFYFVSDKKVAVYSESAGDEPLTVIRFTDIDEADIQANDSFFVDSEITLRLKDGQVVSFPVSSENGKDRDFFNEIKQRMSQRSSKAR